MHIYTLGKNLTLVQYYYLHNIAYEQLNEYNKYYYVFLREKLNIWRVYLKCLLLHTDQYISPTNLVLIVLIDSFQPHACTHYFCRLNPSPSLQKLYSLYADTVFDYHTQFLHMY